MYLLSLLVNMKLNLNFNIIIICRNVATLFSYTNSNIRCPASTLPDGQTELVRRPTKMLGPTLLPDKPARS